MINRPAAGYRSLCCDWVLQTCVCQHCIALIWCRFRIPPYFALIIRAIGVLEGIALVGDPGEHFTACPSPLSTHSPHSGMEVLGALRPSHTLCMHVVCCAEFWDTPRLQNSPSWTRRTRTLRSGCCAMMSPACRPPCATWCAHPQCSVRLLVKSSVACALFALRP